MKLTTEEAKAYHPAIWQDCLTKARLNTPRTGAEKATVRWTETDVARVARRAEAYQSLRERGIREGWLVWDGGYRDGEYHVELPEVGAVRETTWVEERLEKYEARVAGVAEGLFADILASVKSIEEIAATRLGLGGEGQ